MTLKRSPPHGVQATRPPTGASSNSDIEGAHPNKNAIYRAGSKCDWTRARAADANERGQSSRGRENVGGNDGQLGPSRIASAIQHYVIDPTVSPAGSPRCVFMSCSFTSLHLKSFPSWHSFAAKESRTGDQNVDFCFREG